MVRGEDRFQAFDNLSLYYQWWKPEKAQKAVVVFVHGAFEHSSRYAHLAEYLAGCDYAFYAFDLRGHGRSGGERAFIRSFDELVTDLEYFVLLVRSSEPGMPIFLLGQSVGGAIAARFILREHPSFIKGIILASPALKIKSGVSFLSRLFSPLASKVFPVMRLKQPDSRFLSPDPAVVSDYNNDPFVYKEGVPALSLAEFIKAVNKIRSEITKIDIPFFILHGREDRIAGPEGSRELYLKSAGKDKSLNIYQGQYHDLLNGAAAEKALKDIASWLESRY